MTSPNFTKTGTVNSVMNLVMAELGLAAPANFTGSSDILITQMLAFLTAAGQDLCLMYDWQWLHSEWTLNMVATQTTYSLPADWNGFVDSTLWDNTSRLPVIGPITPQVWRMLKARLLGGNTISLQYRIVGNQIVFYYPAVNNDVLQADYYSRGWIQDQNYSINSVTRDNPQNDGDVILFDPRIIVPFVKLKWRGHKQFDTTNEQQEFEDAWNIVVGRDTPAPILNISPRIGYPYLGYINIPDSTYGTSS